MFAKLLDKLRRNQTRIGLALGGGAALGAAHVGVIQALEERAIPIECISGTSIGAFVGALYACGKSTEEMAAIARELRWLDVSSLTLSQYGLLSNHKLGDLLKQHIGDVSLEDAGIPLAIVATDISSGKKVVFREGNVATAVMASTCVPGIFKPVIEGDRVLVDGGVLENVPVSPLKENGSTFVIGVDLNAANSCKKVKNIIDVLVNSLNILLTNATQLQTAEADLLITPDLSSFSLTDPDQADALIGAGYQEAKSVLEKSELYYQ